MKVTSKLAKTISLLGKTGIDECFVLCNESVINVTTIGLQGSQCLCYTKSFQDIKAASSMVDESYKCDALCTTTEHVLLCGSSSSSSSARFSYYEFSESKEIQVFSFMIYMKFMGSWPILCKFILKFKKLFEMTQERVQMICGQYQAKSSASRHRKKCIPCKLMKTMNDKDHFIYK